ncbi:MAG: aminotransferase class III-fold pyridoxal phosphate-dependent enzyme [Candidatus Omnitrophica bacterium]|nr:aminotransferase class III-fold pyridoxal phosphate-dependent enzyme [Candidatus Omnitrophota bacterium]
MSANKKLGLRYGIKKSDELWRRALKVIATGTQTFSRSPGVFPDGAAPKYVIRQKGSHVWDVDGNEFIDMVMGCGPTTLGHNYEPINEAIKKQMDKGILFSLLNPLEVEVAEKLVECIPCAEMLKFSKNGSDVCAAAVRLARAVTGKEMILCYGYHGFQDWYIGSTDRNAGVPKCVRELTKSFRYNDISGLSKMFEQYHGRVAAVIMEPVIAEKPKDDFLNKVKALAHENGALLIFDEMISGFRFRMGGAQEFFNVVPDLATFGKGITNGMPLGVIAGKRKYMKNFDKAFLSSTYAPEALTLAAASAVIDFYKENDVIAKLWEKGEYLEKGLRAIIDRHGVGKNVSLAGYPVRLMVNTHDSNGIHNLNLATLYQQEMFKEGILCFAGVLMLSYSHSREDLDCFIDSFDKACVVIKNAVESGDDIAKFLRCKPGSPVFKGLRERNAVSN